MHISRRKSAALHNISLHRNACSLEQVKTLKYLGVTLSSNLTWSHRINRKFALRTASHNWSARYSDLLNDLNIPSLERWDLNIPLLYFFPSGLINSKKRSCILCSTSNLCLQQPFTHTSAHLDSFIPGTISVWNTLPIDLTHTLTFHLF